MILNPRPNTWKTYLAGLQHFIDYVKKTPTELIDEARAEIKAWKLMDGRKLFYQMPEFHQHLDNKRKLLYHINTTAYYNIE